MPNKFEYCRGGLYFKGHKVDLKFFRAGEKTETNFDNYPNLSAARSSGFVLPSANANCLSLEKVDSQNQQLCGSITQRKENFITTV